MTADGVLPTVDGYGPASSLYVPTGATALYGPPLGVFNYVESDGTWDVFGCSSTKIQQLQADYTWLDIGTGYTCTAGDDWSMAQFGDYALFTNTTDGMVAYDVPGTTLSAVSGAGAPRFIFTCGVQLVALDCLDGSANRNNRLMKVSGYNDHTNWTTDGADNQPLPDGGALLFGADLKNNQAIIVQERAVRIASFGDVGGGAMFGLQKVSEGLGAVGPRSCVAYDGGAAWLATNGFMHFTIGTGIQRIGAGFIDQWFLNHVDQSRFDKVQASYDPFNEIVWWRYPTNGSSDYVFTQIIGYSLRWNRWVTGSVTSSYLTRLATPGYTINAIDSTINSIDTLIDSRYWQGGQPVFAGLDGSYKYGTFTGAALAAQIEGATALSPVTGLISWATPIDDAPNSTLELGVRDQLSDAITYKTAAGKQASGRVPLRGRGKNIGFRWNNAAGETWSSVKGVDFVTASTGGPR